MNSTNTVGFTTKTPDNLMIDAGAVYKNYGLANEALIGATSGGNTFTIKSVTRDIKVDGLHGVVKGLTRVTSTDVTLLVNFLELTTDIIKMALMATVDTTTNPSYDIITGKTEILLSDYIDNIAIVGKISGSSKPVIIILKNALSSDGIKFASKDSSDNILPVTFTGTIDPLTPTILPYEIRYPKATGSAAPYLVSNPIISNGKIRLDFNDNIATTVPVVNFVATVLGEPNIITSAVRDVNDLSIVAITLTTEPTSGQAVTIAYNSSDIVGNQVSSLGGGALATFPATTVINN